MRTEGDDTGAMLSLQLCLAIASHLSGPSDPSAVTTVASVLDLKVAGRQFEDAQQLMAERTEMEDMSIGARELLRQQASLGFRV